MEVFEVIKRDGRTARYDKSKIRNAIESAFYANNVDGEKRSNAEIEAAAEKLTERVDEELRWLDKPEFSVETIQNIVEKALLEGNYVEIARRYIVYRDSRAKVRESQSRLMRVYREITFADAKDSDVKRENANVDGDTAMGQMLKYGSEGAKEFFLNFMLRPEHAKAHRDGDIHIHDLDFYSTTTTCCQIDLLRLFHNGFGTGHGTLREPQDVRSAAALACIAVQANQNDQHGGQSIVNFDYGLAPYVAKTFVKKYLRNLANGLQVALRSDVDFYTALKNLRERILIDGSDVRLQTLTRQEANDRYYNSGKYDDLVARVYRNDLICARERDYLFTELLADVDELSCDTLQDVQKTAFKQATEETKRATYQAMESLIHNLNTMHSRAGAQTPFSSINYGMDVSPEGRMVVENVLLACEAGLGAGETPIFPIQIFRVKKGINAAPGEPNYDLFQLACRVSAKRLFPNFAFQDAPFNLQYYKGSPDTEIAYMGCRTRVVANVADPRRETTYSRGNLSFTSINLPRLALRANGHIDAFFDALGETLELCRDQLLERFKVQSRKKVKNFPFLMGQGVWLDSEKLGPEDEIGEVLKHGTLSIGFIGLAETLKALVGVHHGESEDAQKLGLEIVGAMRSFCDRAANEAKLNFSLLATPAEGLSGRFVRLDRERYGALEGIADRPYYTNSFHIPVYYRIPCWRKIALEAPYHALTNAGHITYVELDGDATKNPEAFERIVRAMMGAGIGYGAINHPVDVDPVCGYSGVVDGEICPKCGRIETSDQPFDRIRRITGYLVGTVDRFNDAKRAEVEDRVPHSIFDEC